MNDVTDYSFFFILEKKNMDKMFILSCSETNLPDVQNFFDDFFPYHHHRIVDKSIQFSYSFTHRTFFHTIVIKLNNKQV